MAIKGAISKETITKKILDTFKDSFINEKNIIIPMVEGGEVVQIKVTLTASKTIIPNGDVSFADTAAVNFDDSASNLVSKTATVAAPTEEEKENLQKMMESLGF